MAKPAPKKKQKTGTEPSASTVTDSLPDKEAIDALLQRVATFASGPRVQRFIRLLEHLATQVPQVLLFEGGTAEERLNAAHYWALSLNCTASEHAPCLQCSTCIRMVSHMHRDLFFLDGLAGSIKIDMVREVKTSLGEPPHEARYRVIILREAQAMAAPAANALLKSLEEPQNDTVFILLTPQRERLLPTLVSRSMILTLPWSLASSEHQAGGTYSETLGEATEPGIVPSETTGEAPADEMVAWEATLCTFIATGRGLFQRTGAKGAVDAGLVQAIIALCRKKLVHVLGEKTRTSEGLATLFARMPLERLRFLDEVLAEAQDSILAGSSPATVFDWLATRMFLLMPR